MLMQKRAYRDAYMRRLNTLQAEAASQNIKKCTVDFLLIRKATVVVVTTSLMSCFRGLTLYQRNFDGLM
jgi:hypothetical protein